MRRKKYGIWHQPTRKLVPGAFFQYPEQARRYIDRRLAGSQTFSIMRLR